VLNKPDAVFYCIYTFRLLAVLKVIQSVGFRIENIHLKDQERLSKRLSVVAVHRRAYRIFRYGLDYFNKALEPDCQLLIKYI